MSGTFIVRVSVAIALAYYAAAPWIGHRAALPFSLEATPSLLIAHSAVMGLLGLCVLLAAFPKAAPAAAAAYLLLAAVPAGFSETTIRDIAIATASLAITFIREEHIPLRERRILGRLFGRR